ncbi:MAG: cation:proton antiporter [Halieaceae bacterium]|nr:cation:proton antiporter [Halieaceae bacterium]
MTGYLLSAFIYLIAAVIAVPLAKRLGLGSVLGYLIAGVVIGPVLGLVGQETTEIQHFAEFGVVMMLFLVGLELEPAMLWNMRNKLLGLGGLQVGVTAAIVAGTAALLGLDWRVALAIGLIFSLSSTAIVLQTFSEKGLASTEGGRSAFSVLLFQDIAVIPMLALIPLLAVVSVSGGNGSHAEAGHAELSLVAGLSGWMYGAVVITAIVAVVVIGHFLSRPLFRFVASTGLREAFTATALALVIGIAVLMSLVGLSPALGTFLAGVVLANSEFRHELETNIEPFKGLLLGLFFITVGAGIQFPVLTENLGLVLGLTLSVMVAKGAVLFGLALLFKLRGANGWLFTLSLAQAGEFGFVLLSYSTQNHVLPADIVPILSLVVAISMFLTPLLFILYDVLVLPRYQDNSEQPDPDDIDERGTVIIAGIGRFGQIINRLLRANGIHTVVLDREPGQVENMRQIKIQSFYGDASRPDLLHTAGVDEASLFVVAIDEREQAVALVEHLKHSHGHLRVLARAFDRQHHYQLREAGADFVINETYYSALAMGREALRSVGVHPFKAQKLGNAFDDLEQRHREALYQTWVEKPDGERYGTSYQSLFIELEEALSTAMDDDRDDHHERSEREWAPPPKNYLSDFD